MLPANSLRLQLCQSLLISRSTRPLMELGCVAHTHAHAHRRHTHTHTEEESHMRGRFTYTNTHCINTMAPLDISPCQSPHTLAAHKSLEVSKVDMHTNTVAHLQQICVCVCACVRASSPSGRSQSVCMCVST